MEFKTLLLICWRRKWIILGTFVLTAGLIIGGNWLRPKVYQTTAQLLIKETTGASSLLSELGFKNLTPANQQGETSLESHITLLQSAPVLKEVISKLQLKDREGNWLTSDDLLNPTLLLSKFLPTPYISIEQAEDSTAIINIVAEDTDPETAAQLANTLAKVYIQRDQSLKRADYTNVSTFISNQIKHIKREYRDLLQEIKTFRQKNELASLDQEVSKVIEKNWDLLGNKEETINQVVELRAKIEILKQQLARAKETSNRAMNKSPLVQKLREQLTDLKLELASELVDKQPSHPDILAIKKKMSETEQELTLALQNFSTTSEELENNEQSLAGLEKKLLQIDTQIRKNKQYLQSLPQKLMSKSELDLRYELIQERYSKMLEYSYLIGIAKNLTLSNVVLVTPAPIPSLDKPESPKKILSLVLGTFLGIFLGIFTGLFAEYLDDSIKTPEDAKSYDRTFLGSIPFFKRKQSKLINRLDPKDPMAESFRTIKNAIKFVSLDAPVKRFVLSSVAQGDGKTLTCVNLGISFAREGKRVIIVDLDLRLPSVHKMFEQDNSSGLTTILAGEQGLADCLRSTGIENLSFLPTGPLPPDPGSLIETDKLKQLLGTINQTFDVVLIDCPPIFIAADALYLGQQADMLLFILNSGQSKKEMFSQALQVIDQARITRTGIILNKFKAKREGYHYYYYYQKY